VRTVARVARRAIVVGVLLVGSAGTAHAHGATEAQLASAIRSICDAARGAGSVAAECS